MQCIGVSPSIASFSCRACGWLLANAHETDRRLAAILAADVAGYSRLNEADEEGTLNQLRSIRADVLRPQIAGNRGCIVKTTGHGLLVEFSSVDGLD